VTTLGAHVPEVSFLIPPTLIIVLILTSVPWDFTIVEQMKFVKTHMVVLHANVLRVSLNRVECVKSETNVWLDYTIVTKMLPV